MSTTFDLEYKAVTNCPDPAVIDFEITVAVQGGAVLETLTAASAAAATAGVTLTAAPVGGLPLIQVDEAQLTQNIVVTYVSFTTDCGLSLVGDVSLHNIDTGGGNLENVTRGCQLFGGGGGIRDMASNNLPGFHITDQILWLDSIGRPCGIGVNHVPGTFGVTPNNPTEIGGVKNWDPLVYDSRAVEETFDAFLLPNFVAYQPDLRFTKIKAAVRANNSWVFMLSEQGEIWNYGGTISAFDGTNTMHPQAGRGAIPYDQLGQLTPNKIEDAPNGQPWEDFHLQHFATNNGVLYAAAGGEWFILGQAFYRDARQFPDVTGISSGSASQFEQYTFVPAVWTGGTIPRIGADNTFSTNESNNVTFIDNNGDGRIYGSSGSSYGTFVGAVDGGTLTLPGGIKFEEMLGNISFGGVGFMLAIGTDGLVYAWATNASAPTGNVNTASAQDEGTLMASPPGVTFSQLRHEVAQAGALGSDGRIYIWRAGVPMAPIDAAANNDIVRWWFSHDGEVFGVKSTGEMVTYRISLAVNEVDLTPLQQKITGRETRPNTTLPDYNHDMVQASC